MRWRICVPEKVDMCEYVEKGGGIVVDEWAMLLNRRWCGWDGLRSIWRDNGVCPHLCTERWSQGKSLSCDF